NDQPSRSDNSVSRSRMMSYDPGGTGTGPSISYSSSMTTDPSSLSANATRASVIATCRSSGRSPATAKPSFGIGDDQPNTTTFAPTSGTVSTSWPRASLNETPTSASPSYTACTDR